jgi:dTDP-4-amino-4,6-dideoxygalactose transaminase
MPKDSRPSGFCAMSNNIIPHSRPLIFDSDIKAVSSVLESGQIAQGPVVDEFERKFSAFIGKKDAAATSSGTAALHLALLALGVRGGDEVIVPSFVCTAVLNAVNFTGATPVIADINPGTHNISAGAVKGAVSEKTKAVIVPHMFGYPTEIDELSNLGIPLIEDCAQSVGARYKDRNVGSFGILSVFSFYATKLFTSGEGGMVVSDSEELISSIKDLREYDKKDEYKFRFNYKMTDIHAALGSNQLSHLEEFLDRRRMIADLYFEEFKDCDFTLPVRKEGREHIYYRFVARTEDDASGFIESSQKRNVMCQRPVHVPLHVCLGLSGYPLTMEAWKESISIPLYPSLKEEEIEKIIAVVKKIF